jgi:hypothetical protein
MSAADDIHELTIGPQMSLTLTDSTDRLMTIMALAEWLRHGLQSEGRYLPHALVHVLDDVNGHALSPVGLRRFAWFLSKDDRDTWQEVADLCRSLAAKIEHAIVVPEGQDA